MEILNSNKNELIENSKAKKKPKFERVILDNNAKVICKDTLAQLSEKYPGLKISKSDLVNWIIKNNFKALKPPAEKKIYKEFYDEEMFLTMTLKEIKRRRKNGENVDIKKMLKKIDSVPAKEDFKVKSQDLNVTKNSNSVTDESENVTN